jgi:parvulin-like peptidyl-prolyl isomerase
MEATNFLMIDEQPISLNQAINYLQESEKLGTFIGTILHQHVLEQEIYSSDAVEVNGSMVEQMIQKFRSANELEESTSFEQWLQQNGMNQKTFQDKVAREIKLHRFIPMLTEPKLPEFFINKKLFLDRIILSRLVVDQRELAEELKCQVLEQEASFAELVQAYSIAGDRSAGGNLGAVSRGELPDGLRAIIDSAKPGDVVGPLEINGHWHLFQIQQVIPASLSDETLKQSLRQELFEEWIAEKIKSKRVQLRLA